MGIQCRERVQLERMGIFGTEDERGNQRQWKYKKQGQKNKLSLGEAELRSVYLK